MVNQEDYEHMGETGPNNDEFYMYCIIKLPIHIDVNCHDFLKYFTVYEYIYNINVKLISNIVYILFECYTRVKLTICNKS